MAINISRLKSLLKGITWRVIGTLDTIIIAFVVTGNELKAVSIGGIEVFTKIILYYFHERLWNRLPESYFKYLFRKKQVVEYKEVHPDSDWLISRYDREKQLQQTGVVIWMTGLSGSGKTTIAKNLEKKLHDEGKVCRVLDGDILRTGLNSNLGFSEEDRIENIRRVAEVAKILLDSGIIVIVSLITPKESMRKIARDIIGENDFRLVFVDTPLEVCERRDVKGLYAKARKGEIKNFTGISLNNIYEEPLIYDLAIKTHNVNVDLCVDKIYDYISWLQLYNYFQ
ncbi:MAG: adenylyl-sulfate kinase [Spirosomataceae bacterium]